MAGVALIFAKDGAPIDERRLTGLAGAMRYRGGAVATWRGPSVGLARISRSAAGGGIAATARWQLAFDGRIDNRTELASELGCGRPDTGGADDAALVAAALERWDSDAAPRLVGDFAIAAARTDGKRAVLIRDVRGLRPLYYRETSRELICASDLQSLIRDTPSPIHDGMVAEWLTGAPTSHSETVYAGVLRLPMAHLLDITRDSSRRRQYWIPAIDRSIASRTDDERAARLLDTLRTSVATRLGDVGRTALWLSGGLDSSTLAVLLDEVHHGHWQCFTLVHPPSGIDERAFATPVATGLGAAHTVLTARAVTLDDIAAESAHTRDVPAPPNGLQSIDGRRTVAARGFDVALSGLGSDEWFAGSFLSYADLARSGRWVDLAQTIWADRHRDESTRVRLQIAAWALCSPRIQRVIRTALRRRLTPDWIAPAFAQRTSLEDRLRHREIASPDFELLSQRALYDDNIRGSYVAATEMQERINAQCGLDERYPFHDRRMIELSLALPESDRWAGGCYKSVIRRAMANRLPATVVGRQASPNANVLVAQTLARIGGRRFFERLAISESGFVHPPALLQLWDRLAGRASAPGVEVWQLWAVAAMEIWWRRAASLRSDEGATPHVA